MPRKYSSKRQYRKKQYTKKKQSGTNWSSIAKTATSALAIGKRLLDVVNVEYHHFPQQGTSAAIDYNGVMYLLNFPSLGTQDTNRVGDSIKNQRLTVRGKISRTGADSLLRVIILWVQTPTSTITPAAILDLVGGTQAPLSAKSYDNRFQTKFLHDKTYVMDADNTTRVFHINMPINRHTQFEESTTTISTGQLFMMLVSDKLVTDNPFVEWNSRLTFTDN